MASIIRIKRSGTAAGAPASLAQGELAYTWTGGVEKLFIGTGTETAGAAANVEVIGGAYYTGLVDASTAGLLTTSESSIPILGSDGSIDKWLVGNLQLTGNTISSTDTNGAINITPNGAGKTIVTNLYIGDSSTSLQEYIEDISGGSVVGGNVLTATYDDNAGTTTLDLDDTAVTPGNYGSSTEIPTFTVDQQGRLTAAGVVDVATTLSLAAENGTTSSIDLLEDTLNFAAANDFTFTVSGDTVSLALDDTTVTAGSYGSSTEIPTFTVDSKGRLTAAGTVDVATQLTIAADSGTNDTVDLLSDTLTFAGGEGIDTTVSNNQITIAAELATDTNAGVASFNSTNFTVTSGAVVANDITIGTTALSNGETTLTLAGLQSLEVDNLTFDGNAITADAGNPGISLDPNGGHVSVNNANIQDVADPINDTDAANKRYVDEVAQGLTTKPQVKAATTANLTATYANGTSGVGATLTIAPTATLTIDGVSSWSQYDGILVKNQTNAFENGRYYVSTIGDALTDWVLTRCGYCDEASEIPGMYIFVTDGTVNANTGWAGTVDDPDTFTVGTDDIDFYQFSGAGSYTAGEGLTLTGTTFDINLAANGGLEITSDELQLKSSVAGDGLTFNNGVVDVVGTANRISVTADAVDIASTYVGQSSITTLGTIGAGTWQADVIADAYISNTLTITGGSIDATPIGASTRSTGAFTTLAANGAVSFTSTLGVTGNTTLSANLIGNGTTSEINGFQIDGGTY